VTGARRTIPHAPVPAADLLDIVEEVLEEAAGVEERTAPTKAGGANTFTGW
jgi:hypothetical protein